MKAKKAKTYFIPLIAKKKPSNLIDEAKQFNVTLKIYTSYLYQNTIPHINIKNHYRKYFISHLLFSYLPVIKLINYYYCFDLPDNGTNFGRERIGRN